MKGLNKLALATAIAAAPFAANAELQALNDSAMGNVTGQAGVTIELETKVSIGQFKYTDEGSFAVNDIVLGGAGVTADGQETDTNGDVTNGLLDQLKIDIDVANDGDAIIHVGSMTTEDLINPFTGQPVDDGNGGTAQKPVPIDWGMTVGSMELLANDGSGQSTTLISGLSAHGDLAVLDIQVDTETDELWLDVAFDIDDMDFDVDFLAIGIRDMTISGAGTNFDYDGDGFTAEQEVGLTQLDPNSLTQEQAGAIADGVEGKNVGSADGLIAFGKLANYANVSLDIYAGQGLDGTTPIANTDVLRIDINNMYMDVEVGQTLIGGTNIGTIAIDNLAVTDTKLAVYGH
jgi:hypothetical protein